MKKLLLPLFIVFFLFPDFSCRTYSCEDKRKPSEKQRLAKRLQRKKDRAYKKELKKKLRQGKYD
jgi:hypothetical protein